MYHTNALQKQIAQGLSELNVPEHPANLYDPVRYMLQIGGKRIRPLLTLMAADLFSIADMEGAVPAAVAIELFHNFSLVHDDIMDNAPLRRGHRTVHEKWNTNVGILSGDNLLIMAYAQLAKCPADYLPAILETFNTMAAQVCEGQQLDMDFERATAVSIDQYLHMIRLKTSVLLGAALKIGALLAGAQEADAQRIYDFGVGVGIAFQLQDDILDVYGDPAQFGKQRGGDILANKKTYLLVKALEMADRATLSKLNDWLADYSNPSDKISNITTIYDALGVRTQVETAKQHHIEQAYTALDTIPVAITRKAPLRELAHALLNRGQ
ncbi:polyprenyl synthetase family protein [Parapedobacter sp. 10938]|uniref:polyprenyl synthetase family protein n=1 Tax=Parapedobacter flavus TaxID=3110225 RepID=UPI002DBCD707|nr:polyprenyl synthetase family protein [Parapedobacter sp. 10938]MEC3878274.1 polyprenyl synthetase family protein [Parapedobacter sp. 10938]